MSLTHKADQLLRKLDIGTFVFCVGMALYIFLDPNHFTNSQVYSGIVFVLWGAFNIYLGMDGDSRSFERDWIIVGVLIAFYGIFAFLTIPSEILRPLFTFAFVALGVFLGFRRLIEMDG